MEIKTIQPEFEKLITKDTEIELLGNSFSFTEGPVWRKGDNVLLFSDIPKSKIYSWTPEKGIGVFREDSHFSNGLTLDNQGNLIACEHQSRSVTREIDGKIEILAEKYGGERLNSPNDVVCARDGSIIFSDPIYGLRTGMGGPAEQELDYQGVFLIPPDSKELILITEKFERPNGVALSSDDTTLYVTDTVRQHICVLEIGNGWQFSKPAVWAELWDEEHGGRPDGIKLDCNGNVFSTGPGGVWVFNQRADLIGRIFLPEKTSNLAWGEDGHSLFITSSRSVFRIRCETHGIIPGLH